MRRPILLLSGLLASAPAFATDSTATAQATPAPTATAGNVNSQNSLKTCNRKADARKLTGKARSIYVRDCRAGKPTD